jgi:hypothetical protein
MPLLTPVPFVPPPPHTIARLDGVHVHANIGNGIMLSATGVIDRYTSVPLLSLLLFLLLLPLVSAARSTCLLSLPLLVVASFVDLSSLISGSGLEEEEVVVGGMSLEEVASITSLDVVLLSSSNRCDDADIANKQLYPFQ